MLEMEQLQLTGLHYPVVPGQMVSLSLDGKTPAIIVWQIAVTVRIDGISVSL